MLDRLKEAEIKYVSLEAQLADPQIFSDQEKFTSLMKEYKALTPVIEKYREYMKVASANAEAREMLDEQLDADMREMVTEEFKATRASMDLLLDELKVLLLPRDPNDDKNVMVEIRSGAGGEEAALFAGVLYRMYTMYAT